MAKGTPERRRNPPRQCRRSTPYPMLTNKLDADLSKKKCTDMIKQKKDWEEVTCSVCMEFPHNAVLLLCSSYDKGCLPFMCGTSCRFSNCLDQYKKAYSKVTSEDRNQPLHGGVRNNRLLLGPPVPPSMPKAPELACPLCRGQVKGWTVVESAREFLNGKKRACMEDDCTFLGTYKELRKHVRSVHPSARPWEVDPAHEQKWERLEWERERDDVISTLTSSTPGSVVFGDYVIERNPYAFDIGFDFENDDLLDDEVEEVGRLNDAIDSTLSSMLLLFRRFGSRRGNMSRLAGLRRRDDDGRVDSDDNGGGTSLASRLRRQGRSSLGRLGRRQHREANGGQF